MQQTNIKVSIIIPIYNVAKYLRECLNSCIRQTYKNIEIICVDDGSTDGCKQIVDEYALFDERITVIHKTNGGLPSARKAGIEGAKGDYIFHLDGDDNIPNNAIESLVVVVKETNADIVVGNHFSYEEDGNKILHNSRIPKLLFNNEYINFILKEGLFNIWGKLIRRNIYTSNTVQIPVGISIGEDLVHIIQLAYYSKICAPCNDVVYNYYIRPSSMSKINSDVVGQLTDRSIYAVDFIIKFLIPCADKDTLSLLVTYAKSFVYEYLRSPHSVFIRQTELNNIVLFIKETNGQIKSFRDLICYIAFYSLSFAKFLTKFSQIKDL